MPKSPSVMVIAMLMLGLPSMASAGTCALCRQALASGGSAGLVRGFYWSILLIAGIPLMVLGALGVMAWRQWRIGQAPRAGEP